MRRLILVGFGVAVGLYWLSTAGAGHGADANQARLPAALNDPAKVASIYPRLYRNEVARKDGRSWERLRRAARTRWMRTHPCATATLMRRYRLGAASSWATMVATWRCGGMDATRIRFLGCIADHEGGRTHPDVVFGGARGFAGVLGGAANVVLGHLQIRPGWYRGAMDGHPGVYAGDYWTPELYAWASNPVNQARTAVMIGHDQYATAGFCA